jgi:hypothetical protein
LSAIDQITYRAQAHGSGISITETATSIRHPVEAASWRQRLDVWLRTGSPQGSAYLGFGSQAAFIRWRAGPRTRLSWEHALVLTGQSAMLTGTYALELPGLDESELVGATRKYPLAAQAPGPRRAALEERARSADAIRVLIPLLAHALQRERRVILPWTAPGLPDAVMWGLISILRMMGDDRQVSFLTYASAPGRDYDTAGLQVSFRAGTTAPLAPDPGFAALAAGLAHRFADDPADLFRTLAEHGLPEAGDHDGRISRLVSMPARRKPAHVYSGGTATVTATFGNPAPRAEPAAPAVVMCPICLTEIQDWDALGYWRYGSEGDYEEIRVPADVNRVQRARYLHGAYVRCPASQDPAAAVHYLPARYGRFGEPVLLGFVGLTQSGKSHLLASMIGGISQLSDYQIDVHPLDPAMHHRFLENSVKPLITRNEVLPGTPDDATTEIADAFIVRHGSGPERVVALFDVSGGVLAQTDRTREFLWIADGLFFVIDPDHITSSKAGDNTFSNVLNVVRDRAEAESVSAAIVLNKADKARFEEPVARWLQSGNGTLAPMEFLRESADVYSYLVEREAAVLTEPYQVCSKATLHVASPTGGAKEGEERGSKYPRGVTPLRVLRPLVAMLVMTGVLTGPQAETIGA